MTTETDLPTLPHLAVCTSVVAGEVAKGAAPQWIKVTPRGPVQTRDGRKFSFDPEALAARFQADETDIAIDLNHGVLFRGGRGEEVDAIGWAKEIAARADGTYARVEWLDKGKAVLSARTHRYVSPTFYPDVDGKAVWLHSISLVPSPALAGMPALAAAAGLPEPGNATTIAEALGLPAGADQAACLSAIGELRTAFVPIGLFSDAIASLNAANASMATMKADARSARVETLLEGALKAGKILPFERPAYEALCVTDAGLASVATLMTAKQPHGFMRPSGLDGAVPPGEELPEALAARAARYREAQAGAGVILGQVEAITFCSANPSAGR